MSFSELTLLYGFQQNVEIHIKEKYISNLKGCDCVSKRDDYELKATELIMPIVEANNFELVDLEYVKEGS